MDFSSWLVFFQLESNNCLVTLEPMKLSGPIPGIQVPWPTWFQHIFFFSLPHQCHIPGLVVCYGVNVCVLSKFMCWNSFSLMYWWNPNPHGLWELISHEDGALQSRLQKVLSSFLPCQDTARIQLSINQKIGSYQILTSTLILDLWEINLYFL